MTYFRMFRVQEVLLHMPNFIVLSICVEMCFSVLPQESVLCKGAFPLYIVLTDRLPHTSTIPLTYNDTCLEWGSQGCRRKRCAKDFLSQPASWGRSEKQGSTHVDQTLRSSLWSSDGNSEKQVWESRMVISVFIFLVV